MDGRGTGARGGGARVECVDVAYAQYVTQEYTGLFEPDTRVRVRITFVTTAAGETPDSSSAYRPRANELITRLGTEGQLGLSDDDARERLATYGVNARELQAIVRHAPIPPQHSCSEFFRDRSSRTWQILRRPVMFPCP